MTEPTWQWNSATGEFEATDGTILVSVRTPGGLLQPPTQNAAALIAERRLFGLPERVKVENVKSHGVITDRQKSSRLEGSAMYSLTRSNRVTLAPPSVLTANMSLLVIAMSRKVSSNSLANSGAFWRLKSDAMKWSGLSRAVSGPI